ncbi:MAG TPA: trypsin-like peptidase domain-containing protein [Minicystis sp.]|nr:trypsin-like peptidase domain-containing protein [Minicystis sp.]
MRVARWVGALVVSTAAACGGRAAAPPATPSAPAAATSKTLTPAQIAARSTPAVVTIRSPEALGTGFLVRPDGWIATNLHVIAGARELLVVLPDHSEHAVVEVMGVDPERDLAVVRIDAKALPVLTLGDSDVVHPGDPVVAIGHPLGLEDTVSNGLVSAVREVDAGLTVLQISAPIAPGSSGGPLFNDKGEVIGVAAAISREGQNLNFGLPVAYLKLLIKHPQPMSFAKFAAASAPRLPDVKRDVPHHELGVLSGCSEADVEALGHGLEEAIEVGAPLYNGGNFAGCYHVYEGASIDVERKLRPSCLGPRRALGDGRHKAARLKDPAAQAWAMRDAFDGLFDVMVRKLKGQK